MLPHQERVVTELKELQDKYEKLADFMDTDKYSDLEMADKTLLTAQYVTMVQYAGILRARIDRF